MDESALAAVVEDAVPDDGGPGLVAGVVVEGELIWSAAQGLADIEHRVKLDEASVFYLASVSKQFTAAAILMLVDEGDLDLDAAIVGLIGDLPSDYEGVTVRHLVHHTGGVRDYFALLEMAGRPVDDVIDEDDVVAIAARQRGLAFAPGTTHSYSNTGYVLLARIVREVTGRSLSETAAERLFAPLRMERTWFRDDRARVVADLARGYVERVGEWTKAMANLEAVGDGGLLSSLPDVVRWTQALRHADGRLGGVARPGFVGRLTTPGAGASENADSGYAFGLSVKRLVDGSRVIHHGGGFPGFATMLRWEPDRDLFVIVLANSNSVVSGAVARSLAAIAADRKPEPPPSMPDGGPPRAGAYRSPGGSVWVVALDGRQPTIETGGPSPVPLVPAGDGGGYRPIAGPPGEFRFADDRLLYRQGRDLLTLERVTAVVDIAPFVGSYRSEELDATITIVDGPEGPLVDRGGRTRDVKLRPAAANELSAPFGTLRLHDGDLVLSHPRAGDVHAMRHG